MTDREMLAFDARLEMVLSGVPVEARPLRLADLVPEDVVIVPRDPDEARLQGFEPRDP